MPALGPLPSVRTPSASGLSRVPDPGLSATPSRRGRPEPVADRLLRASGSGGSGSAAGVSPPGGRPQTPAGPGLTQPRRPRLAL